MAAVNATDEIEVEEGRKLFVGGLPLSTTDESLMEAFKPFGKVQFG